MLPTLNFTGEVLLVEKMSPLLGKVGPGDVVLVRSPENPRKCIIKRIVGVAGDTVSFLVDPGNSDRSHSLVVPKGMCGFKEIISMLRGILGNLVRFLVV